MIKGVTRTLRYDQPPTCVMYRYAHSPLCIVHHRRTAGWSVRIGTQILSKVTPCMDARLATGFQRSAVTTLSINRCLCVQAIG